MAIVKNKEICRKNLSLLAWAYKERFFGEIHFWNKNKINFIKIPKREHNIDPVNNLC